MGTLVIVSFFTENGTPKTGLSPTIRIRNLADNSLVITDAAMTEVGDGFYKYLFTSYDEIKNYSFRSDGTSNLDDHERYVFGTNENNESTQSRMILANKLEIKNNQLIIYDDDGVTVARTYNLVDRSGSPVEKNIFKRTQV